MSSARVTTIAYLLPMPAPWPRTDDELRDAACWFASDRVGRDDAMTAFKRRARWQQAWWRESRGLAPGSHLSGKPRLVRPNGSKLDPSDPGSAGANFLNQAICAAVQARLDAPQPHQTLDCKRLAYDLLSSMPMCFNLFGELCDKPDRRQSAVAELWPDLAAESTALDFEWSPGRRDPSFLGDRTAFDAAIHLDTPGGRGVIGIETKYHEHAIKERKPTADGPNPRLPRYEAVTETSEIFVPGWRERILGTPLQQLWRDHLLVLAMLQHPSGQWAFGRYVLVYPQANTSFAAAAEAYAECLIDTATFEAWTLEELLEPGVLHEPSTAAAFRDRYLW